MADSGKFVQSLVTRLCAAKVCQNISKYEVITEEMKTKSKAMGYGENLSVIPPFAYSHLLYESMRKYENNVNEYESLKETLDKLRTVAATPAQKTELNDAIERDTARIVALNDSLKVTDTYKINVNPVL